MVKTEQRAECILCLTTGRVLYPRVEDYLFGNEGRFGEMICPKCGLIWLSPRPVQEEMGEFYKEYYTHTPVDDSDEPVEGYRRFLGGLRDAVRAMIFCGYYGYVRVHSRHRLCFLGRILGSLPSMRLRATNVLKELIPHYKEGGLVLDIGSGRGDFLLAMQSLGWKVLGVEQDPVSAAIARDRGLPVQNVPFEEADIPRESAHHITMNHVIEHFYDPIAVIRKCHDILKPGGTMVLYAPNTGSLGHRVFEGYWLPLDPPRHLYSFSRGTMLTLLERCGFPRPHVKTFSRLAVGVFDTSRVLQRGIVTKAQTPPPQRGRQWFSFQERLSCAVGMDRGEEIVAIASKRG